MANTFTDVYQQVYVAMEVVSKRVIGMIPAVSMDSSAAMASRGQTIESPVVAIEDNADITPANIHTQGGDMQAPTTSMTLNKARKQSWHFTGEEMLGLMNSGTFSDITRQRIEGGIEQLIQEIEADLGALYVHASRAYGTAGTTPFATANDLRDLSMINRILTDNGAPRGNRALALGTLAYANLLGLQPAMFRANEAGYTEGRRSGMLMLPEFGMLLAESNGLPRVHDTGGTLTGVAVDQDTAPTGYFVGDTAIDVDGGGAGETRNLGDFITFAGDANKYMVDAYPASGTRITLHEPGLLQNAADNAAITGSNMDYAPNLAFSRDAIHLAVRRPALPTEGDAGMHMPMVDPMTGLVFDFATYRGYHSNTYELGIVWGVKAHKPEHMAVLLG